MNDRLRELDPADYLEMAFVVGTDQHGQRYLTRKDAGTAKTVTCVAVGTGARFPYGFDAGPTAS